MRNEAKANEASDKIEKEKVEKINQADALIFQSDKQLKEYGEKLSEGNKSAIESALSELKVAHASQDLASIDAGLEKLNAAWTAASQEMYAAGENPGGSDANPSQDNNADANGGAEDVAFEEVK
jgi:molecular chaperone DnaK